MNLGIVLLSWLQSLFPFQGLKLVLSSVAMEEEAMETDNQQDPNGEKYDMWLAQAYQ